MSGTSAGKQESSERTLYEGVACLKSSIGEVQKPGQDRITPRLPGQGWSSRAPEGDGPRAEAEPLAEKCSQPNHSGGLGWGRSWGQKGLKCFLPTPDLHWCSGLTEKCMCGGGEGGKYVTSSVAVKVDGFIVVSTDSREKKTLSVQ